MNQVENQKNLGAYNKSKMESNQRNDLAVQKARISRAYLDAAKSFGIEQDIEFCPCLDLSTIDSYNNGYASSVKMRQQGSNIDSESIFKILAAAANINSNKKITGNNSNTSNNSNNNNNIGKINNIKDIKQMSTNSNNGFMNINKYYS